MNVSGKKVLITGGAIRGGAFLCRIFAWNGSKVIIHCHNSQEEAKTLCTELGGEKAGHSVYICDLTDVNAAEQMILDTAPDILINSAASYERAGLPDETEEAAMRQYTVNFLAPAAMIRTLHHIKNGEPSVVINIVDSAITATDPVSFSYSISKKALAEATKAAALQCAPAMRVNAVAPGHMIPPEHLRHLNMQRTNAGLPLKRGADPEDFAEAVLFLVRNESITGVVLPVDCGQALLSGEFEK